MKRSRSAQSKLRSKDDSDSDDGPKQGQTECDCGKIFNNAWLPDKCDSCNNDLGYGNERNKRIKTEGEPRAYKIDDNIASVRTNIRGVGTRNFVNFNSRKCYTDKCALPYQLTDPSERKNITCEHLRAADECVEPEIRILKIDEQSLAKFSLPIDTINNLAKYAPGGEMKVHILPSNTLVIPSLSDITTAELDTKYVHIKDDKCKLQSCGVKNRIHSLIGKTNKLCLHQIVALISKNVQADTVDENVASSSKGKKPLTEKIDKAATAKIVIDKIKKNFPKLHQDDQVKEFLKTTKNGHQMISELDDTKSLSPNVCSACERELVPWKSANMRKGILLTIGSIKEIDIEARYCSSCSLLHYPDVEGKGFIPLHNRLLISFDFIMDILNNIECGTPLIEYIKKKITLLASRENLDLSKDIQNIAIRIEKLSIVSLSLLVTGESLDEVICLICGMFPKILATDGNSKDTNEIKENMQFVENDDPIPTLEEFLDDIQTNAFTTTLFPKFPQMFINLNKVPPIIAPKLQGKPINREQFKKSQFTKSPDKNINLHTICELIRTKELDIINLEKYSVQEIKDFAKMCNIETTGISSVALKEILKAAYKSILSGDGNCHGYAAKQNRTGGWTDAWCSHLFKNGAKLQARQESVIDPVDLIRSFKKLPVLHICDDACTVASHIILSFPDEAKETLEDRRGCFEKPSKDKFAVQCIEDNTDILPIEKQPDDIEFDYSAVGDDCIRHPDTGHHKRYILGHRLQMKSHKKEECSYHVIDLVESGKKVKTLNQEALQVRRKYRRVMQNRKRSFGVSFLFNYILDYCHNREKFKKQINELKKDSIFQGRDERNWRGKIVKQ